MIDEETRMGVAKVIADGIESAVLEDVRRGGLAPSMVANRLRTKADDIQQQVARQFPGLTVLTGPCGPTPLRDLQEPAQDLIRRRAERTDVPVPVPWRQYGKNLGGGYFPGVHVLVSGTGAGKSTLCTDLAIHAAQQGHPVGYVTLELSRVEAAIRLAASRAGVWFSKLITGAYLDDLARQAVDVAFEEVSQLPITIESAGLRGFHAEKLHDVMREVRKSAPRDPDGVHRTPLIIVDYLQLMGGGDDRADARERVATAAYEAHGIATEHQCAVLLVSSVGRNSYKLLGESNEARHTAGVHVQLNASNRQDRDDEGRPMMNDRGEEIMRYYHNLVNSDALVGLGKESGDIEFAATTVTAMTKVPRDDSEDGAWRALMLAKNRYGSPSWSGCELKDGTLTEVVRQGDIVGALEDSKGRTESSQRGSAAGHQREHNPGRPARSGMPPQ